MLVHKTSHNTFKRIKIVCTIFSDYNEITLEMNNRMGELDESDEKGETSSFKINKSWRHN